MGRWGRGGPGDERRIGRWGQGGSGDERRIGRWGQGNPAHPVGGPGSPVPAGPSGPLGLIQVYRPEEEVFAPETIASFEGMAVTNDHPPDGVNINNIRRFQKGHVHNVRRGSGKESDLLLADLIITDPELIELILGGKREISCGYTYELCEENGKFIQRKIRGNHVAVVDAGRAGHRVSIRDREPNNRMGRRGQAPQAHVNGPSGTVPTGPNERRGKGMKKSLSKILARMAKDGDIETVAEIIEEMIEPEGAESAAEEAAEEIVKAADPEAVIRTPEATIVVDEATMAEIVMRLDRIIELLTPAAADDEPAEEVAEAVEEALEAAAAEESGQPYEGIQPEDVEELIEEILEPEDGEEPEGEALRDECEEEQKLITSGDALSAALRAVRPMLKTMTKKQRDRVCMDIAAKLGRTPGRLGADEKMMFATRRSGRGDALGKRIMAKRNVNCRR